MIILEIAQFSDHAVATTTADEVRLLLSEQGAQETSVEMRTYHDKGDNEAFALQVYVFDPLGASEHEELLGAVTAFGRSRDLKVITV